MRRPPAAAVRGDSLQCVLTGRPPYFFASEAKRSYQLVGAVSICRLDERHVLASFNVIVEPPRQPCKAAWAALSESTACRRAKRLTLGLFILLRQTTLTSKLFSFELLGTSYERSRRDAEVRRSDILKLF